MSRNELESAYERQARQARKTVRQLKAKYPSIIGLEDFGSDFKTLYKLGDLTDEQLRKELLFTTNFNRSQFRSVGAYEDYRSRVIEQMSSTDENGNKRYNVTEENFDKFARGMKRARNSGLLNLIPSDMIADFYTSGVDTKRVNRALDRLFDEYSDLAEDALDPTLSPSARRLANEKLESFISQARGNVEYWIDNPDLQSFRTSKKRKSGNRDYFD